MYWWRWRGVDVLVEMERCRHTRITTGADVLVEMAGCGRTGRDGCRRAGRNGAMQTHSYNK